MKSTVQKLGNNLAIPIPESFASEINLSIGTEIYLVIIENKIQIEPIKKNAPLLNDLLDKITEENIHQEINIGTPVVCSIDIMPSKKKNDKQL
ncbi:transcriptional regulator/antitoxin, MazE [Candidatus Magnetomorum sp. HK-1]|nr:transcriptional regulator/antitoxin, MazE [Candidatus Magnetomorum sp. HK-1]